MKRYLKIALVAVLLMALLPLYALATEVYFSPQGGAQKRIIELIGGAKKSIDIAMYGLTSPEIADAVVKAKERGVPVRMVLDRTQAAGKESQSGYLQEQGLSIRVEHQKGIMHNKICIIDGSILITGSYNWTRSAEDQNQENLLVLTTDDDAELVKRFQERFEYIWRINDL